MNTLFSRPAFKLLSISAVALAASALLTTAPPSYAQTPPPPAAQSMHRMPTPEQMTAHAQKRLDKLERSLNLQPGQQAAWASYKGAALADMKEHAAKMQLHREQMQQSAAMSAPQRMEEQAKQMREHADALSRKAQQTQSLYSVLTPDQRTIFDLQMQRHSHKFGQRRMQQRNG